MVRLVTSHRIVIGRQVGATADRLYRPMILAITRTFASSVCAPLLMFSQGADGGLRKREPHQGHIMGEHDYVARHNVYTRLSEFTMVDRIKQHIHLFAFPACITVGMQKCLSNNNSRPYLHQRYHVGTYSRRDT